MESDNLAAITNFKEVTVKESELPPLEAGEVKIRVFASNINPSDRGLAHGAYSKGKQTADEIGLGFEGSGEVIEVGEGVENVNVGQRVAFCTTTNDDRFFGAWRRTTIVPARQAIPFPDTVEYDSIFAAFINPLTVSGFIDTAQKAGQ